MYYTIWIELNLKHAYFFWNLRVNKKSILDDVICLFFANFHGFSLITQKIFNFSKMYFPNFLGHIPTFLQIPTVHIHILQFFPLSLIKISSTKYTILKNNHKNGEFWYVMKDIILYLYQFDFLKSIKKWLLQKHIYFFTYYVTPSKPTIRSCDDNKFHLQANEI